MPAIVRVKRRIDEEPLTAFVLNGKKRRIDFQDGEARTEEQPTSTAKLAQDEVSAVLHFAGTITEQQLNDDAETTYARLNKKDAENVIKQKVNRRTANLTERGRAETRQSSHENRFRVVNCMRTTLNDVEHSTLPQNADEHISNEEGAAALSAPKRARQLTIVDIERQESNAKKAATGTTENAVEFINEYPPAVAQTQQPSDSDTGYVYDLYVPVCEETVENVDLSHENYLSVFALNDLLYEDPFYNKDQDEEYDSEDSNQENHYANDYPDDEDVASDNDYDSASDGTRKLTRAIKNFILDDDEERNDSDDYAESSSSDYDYHCADEDPYVHSVYTEDNDFVQDIDFCDGKDIEDCDEYGNERIRL